MNLKILRTNLQFVGEIDDFESFFTVLVHGDRSMARVTIKAEKNNTDVLVKGNYIYAENAPEYLFIITDVQKVFDEKGCTLNLVAYDVFWILEGRITSAGTTAISNTAKSVEYTIKDWLTKCVVNPTDTNRAVSGLELGANQDRGSTINTVVYHTPLADNIKKLLAIDGLGLRGGYNSTTKKFVVDVYEGADRSVGNTDGNAPVIFDIKYDNVIGGEQKDSNAKVRNHAYVFCNREGARVMVEQPEPSGEATGALRREFAIATTDSLTDADMGFLGLSGLVSEERSVTVNHTALVGSFVYGVDYFLGDFVTVAGVKLRLVEVARAWEGHREKIDLTFGQKVVTEQTQTQENTARLQDLEVKVLGVGFGDALGPDGATADNFASFADTSGKVLKDSGKKAADFATASHHHDAAYLGISAKAADADKLDGNDSSYFAAASAIPTVPSSTYNRKSYTLAANTNLDLVLSEGESVDFVWSGTAAGADVTMWFDGDTTAGNYDSMYLRSGTTTTYTGNIVTFCDTGYVASAQGTITILNGWLIVHGVSMRGESSDRLGVFAIKQSNAALASIRFNTAGEFTVTKKN